MGIFGLKRDKKRISKLEQENKENIQRIQQLESLCEERFVFYGADVRWSEAW